MKNTKKNLILFIQDLKPLHHFIESKLKAGNATILMHEGDDLIGELLQHKLDASCNTPRTVDTDNDSTSIQIKQDIDTIILTSSESDKLGSVLQGNEMVILKLSESNTCAELPQQIEQLAEQYPQFNLFIILKLSNENLPQHELDTQAYSGSIDCNISEAGKLLLQGLIPVQSHKCKNYYEVATYPKRYAFLIQWSNYDHRVDESNDLDQLVRMEHFVKISGRQLNIQNFWRELLFINSKFPKFGA